MSRTYLSSLFTNSSPLSSQVPIEDTPPLRYLKNASIARLESPTEPFVFTNIVYLPSSKGNDVRSRLRNTGLFNTLLDYLSPDIILVSTNRAVFDEVFGDFAFEGERYQNPDNPTILYVRKYRRGSQVLFWIFNNRGMAFGPRFDFIANSIKDLE